MESRPKVTLVASILAPWLLMHLGAVATLAGPAPDEPATRPLKPAPLAPGDTIGLLAPAGPLDLSRVQAAAANLKSRGYKVKISRHAGSKLGYLAGSDAERVADLHEFFSDPTVKAILCIRGGYGSPRILDLIDYDLVRKHPKIVVGYSDITALHLALRKKTGLVVFHGPMAKEWAAGNGITPFSEAFYWDVFRSSSERFSHWGKPSGGVSKPRMLAPGSARGRLVGGNLSVICALMGTPYEIDTRGAILFIEEVGEKMFRVDRMLNQLRLGGQLSQARGILVGQFTSCEERYDGVTLEELFQDYFGQLKVPVLTGFPAGHAMDHAILPMGIMVKLDSTAGTLSLLEPPVRGDRSQQR